MSSFIDDDDIERASMELKLVPLLDRAKVHLAIAIESSLGLSVANAARAQANAQIAAVLLELDRRELAHERDVRQQLTGLDPRARMVLRTIDNILRMELTETELRAALREALKED